MDNEIRVVISGTAAQLREALSGAKGDLGDLKTAIVDMPKQLRIGIDLDTVPARGQLGLLAGEMRRLKERIESPLTPKADVDPLLRQLSRAERAYNEVADAAAKAALASRFANLGGGADSAALASIFRGRDGSGGAAGALGAAAAGGGGGGGGLLGMLTGGGAAGAVAGGAAAAVTGVAASAGQGLLGAGAIGSAGLGAVVLGGLLPLMTLVKPALGDIQTLSAALTNLQQVQELYGKNQPALVAAQDKYTQAVAAFGPNSRAAINAHAQLVLQQHAVGNSAPQVVRAQMAVNKLMLESSPGARSLAVAFSNLDSSMNDAGLKIIPQLSAVLRPLISSFTKDLLPTLVTMAKIDLRGLAVAIKPLLDIAKSAEFKSLLLQLAQNFAKLMPLVFKGLGDLLLSFMRVAVAAGPAMLQMAGAFTGLLDKVAAFTASPALGPAVAGVISQFKSWLGLAGAVGKLLYGIFSQGAGSGQTLVDTLTQLVKAITPALIIAFHALSILISGIASAIQALTDPLPGLAKIIPSLAIGAGVLFSWSLLKAAVAGVADSAKAAALAMIGIEAAPAAGAVGAAGAAAGAGAAGAAGRTAASAATVQAVATGGAGAAGAGGAAAVGVGSLILPVAAVLGVTFGLTQLASAVNGDGGVNAALKKMQQQMRDALNAGDPTKLDAISRSAQTLADKTKFLGGSASSNFHAVATQAADLATKVSGSFGLLMSGQAAKVAPFFADMAAQSGKSLSDIELAARVWAGIIPTTLGAGSLAAHEALAHNFLLAAQDVQASMASGVVSASKGMAEILKLVTDALHALGSPVTVADVKAIGLASAQQLLASTNTGHGPGPGIGHHFSGGKVTQPGYFAGEEAPQHPEFILATNPAYRDRNLNLWASAGHELGVPGFATGGVAQKGSAGVATGGTGVMGRMVQMANQINARHFPYLWGGGHNSSFTGPYDCSGAVSAVLHSGGLLNAPEVSGQFESYGLPGPGRVTLYANPTHVYMSLDGHFFGTSGANAGGGAGWFAGAPRPGFVVRHIDPSGKAGQIGGPGGVAQSIAAPKIGLRGLIGQVGQGALNKVTAAANAKIQAANVASIGPGGGGGGGNLNENLANQAIGRSMMLAAGWGPAQWPALRALWAQESGWDANAVNSSSGAYGIPQSLGHGHPFALGDVRAQVAWGLDYIRGRYGSPSGAEAHEQAFSWYRKGGIRGVPRYAPGGIHTTKPGTVRATAAKAAQHPPKPAKVTHPKSPKVHVPAAISDALKRLLPGNVVRLDNTAARYAQRQVDLAGAESQLDFTQGLPPYPAQALVSITDADVQALDPTGALGYQAGDELVNQSGMTVGRFFGPAGIAGGSWVPGIDQRQSQIAAQLSSLYGQVGAITHAGISYDGAVAAEGRAKLQRADRRRRVLAYLRTQVIHAKAIQAEIAAATTGNLQANLRRALSRQAISRRLGSLRQNKQTIAAELLAERSSQAALPSLERDPTHTSALQAQLQAANDAIAVETQLGSGTGASAAVQAAKSALYRRSLRARLASFATVDRTLGGKPYDVGSGGIVGELQKQMDALDANASTEKGNKLALATPLQDIRNKITSYLVESAGLGGTSAVQVRTPGLAGTATMGTDAAMLALVQTQLQQTQQALAVSQAQFGVLSGFAPLLQGRLVGSFQSGISFVPATGPALVHRGEMILPAVDGPQGNRAAATVHTAQGDISIELTFANNEPPLMKLIDAKMNQKSLQIVSDHAGQRARLLSGVRRG